MDLPSYDLEKLRPYVQVTEGYQPAFHNFLEKFKLLRRFYTNREAIERITLRGRGRCGRRQCQVPRIALQPGRVVARAGLSVRADVMDWVCAPLRNAQADHDIIVRLIVSIKRDEPETAEESSKPLSSRESLGIVAFDISGDEVNYSARAVRADLSPRPAGRAGIDRSCWRSRATRKTCAKPSNSSEPERIGHGVRCIEDSDVVRLVRDSGVTLEFCPTSNSANRRHPLMGHHPLPDLYRLGSK